METWINRSIKKKKKGQHINIHTSRLADEIIKREINYSFKNLEEKFLLTSKDFNKFQRESNARLSIVYNICFVKYFLKKLL